MWQTQKSGKDQVSQCTSNRPGLWYSSQPADHLFWAAAGGLGACQLSHLNEVEDWPAPRIKGELKWLNGQLGTVRDLDVAIERLEATTQEAASAAPPEQEDHLFNRILRGSFS
jgi:hypothetical protein